MEPTVTRISDGECEWSVDDPYWHGHQMPHGIKARRLVTGAGEFLDGRYCVRHANKAVECARDGVEVEL